MCAAPVRDYRAVKSPFLLEYLVQDPVVMAEMFAFEQVVRTHDRPCASFLHGRLESREIDFIKSTVIDNSVIMMAVSLLIVERKMLYAHCHSVFLHFPDIWNSHLACKERIFAHIFEVSTTKRGTVDVYARTEKHILFTIAGLFANRFSVKSRHLL